MKKRMMLRTLLAIAVLCMSVAFVACQKSEVSNPSNVAKNEVKNPRSGARESMFPNMLVGCQNDIPNSIDCKPTPADCTSFIEVYAMVDIQIFESIITVIETGNAPNIANAFQEHRDFLLNYLYEAQIDGIINQELTVEHRFNANTNYHFLIFKQGNTIDAAYPIQFVNE